MKVCDKCKKEPVILTLRFKTKSFDLCKKCSLKIVNWLEDKPLKEKMSNLWNQSLENYGHNQGLGGGI
jgi:hypothetical protein